VLDEVRAEVFPILDDTHRTIATLATIAERIQNGEGSVGRLVSNDTMVRAIEQSITGLNSALDDIKATTKEARALAAKVNAGDDGVPALLANLQTVTRDIAQTTPRLPKIARNAEGASTDLPALLTQTQIATTELEKPLTQMRGMWAAGRRWSGNAGIAPAAPGRAMRRAPRVRPRRRSRSAATCATIAVSHVPAGCCGCGATGGSIVRLGVILPPRRPQRRGPGRQPTRQAVAPAIALSRDPELRAAAKEALAGLARK